MPLLGKRPALRHLCPAREQDRLDEEALAWSRSQQLTDFAGYPLRRYAAVLTLCTRGKDGTIDLDTELVVHFAARDTRDAQARLPLIAVALDSSAEAEFYNLHTDEENPGFVLRGVVGSGSDHELLDSSAMWLCDTWPGYHAQFLRTL